MKICARIAALILVCAALPAQAISNVFTYQGALNDGGLPANGAYDFEFQVYRVVGGAAWGDPWPVDDLTVSNGIFTAQVNVSAAFEFDDYELEIRIRPGASTGAFTTLSPRTAIRIAPQSHASNLATVSDVALTVNDNAITTIKIAPGAVNTSDIANAAVGAAQIAANAVGTAQIANGAVGSAQITDGSITATDVNTNSVQARVSGSCASGSNIGAIASDGSVTCQTASVDPTTATISHPGEIENIINFGTGAGDVDAEYGLDGNLFIAYYDDAARDLWAVHCQVPDCSLFNVSLLDGIGDVGRNPQIVIMPKQSPSGTYNGPIITYYDQTNGILKRIRCDNPGCTSSTASNLAATAGAGPVYVSMPSTTSRYGVVFYLPSTGNLQGIECTGFTCAAAFDVDNNANDVGLDLTSAPGPRGHVLAYRNATTGNLIARTCVQINSSANCASNAIVDNSGTVSKVLAVAVPDGGRPMFLYQTNAGNNASIISCANADCSSTIGANSIVLPAAASAGAISFSTGQVPYILLAHVGTNTHARVYCEDTLCSGTLNPATLNLSGTAVSKPRLLRNAWGNLVIIQRDGADLKLRVCDNPWCSGVGRR